MKKLFSWILFALFLASLQTVVECSSLRAYSDKLSSFGPDADEIHTIFEFTRYTNVHSCDNGLALKEKICSGISILKPGFLDYMCQNEESVCNSGESSQDFHNIVTNECNDIFFDHPDLQLAKDMDNEAGCHDLYRYCCCKHRMKCDLMQPPIGEKCFSETMHPEVQDK